MIIRWNLTSRLARLKNADVIVVSPGKSGRTWLRVLVNKYLSLHYGVAFSIGNLHEENSAIPSVVYQHWLWSHFRAASWLDRLRGRHIIPEPILRRKKVILLVRDPRDGIVSVYFQGSKRAQEGRKLHTSLSEFIRSPRHGIGEVVRILNLMYDRLKDHPRCLMVKYESMRKDTAGELTRVLRFLGIAEPDPGLVAEAVSFSAFENMKRMERNNEFTSRILRATDSSDPDSFKVRKGKVGGYRDHFDQHDLAYIESHLAGLNPAYGYSTAPGLAHDGTNAG
jgi:hypothetical protein